MPFDSYRRDLELSDFADEQLRDKRTKQRTQVEKEVRRDWQLLQPIASSMASRRKHTIRCHGLC
ncbi:hypothetical protein F2Q70_00029032 [Brassica cretica]|uniref:Uncharacterized protein n=1 Tax=Brassica cretica TaxID=69181 RepID=A0A8S9FEI8_BRACR|nr:hypothetical protein F2Q70_00029032 [Brassica cretica]KAF2553747.1 hypothetical protein F2Q68_00033416 [Brassica cretica]